jgi:hypothetical protein
MSYHRYPTCPISGKVRYGERKDIKLALRQADRDRSRARLNQMACSRREIRVYHCCDCGGWHLTSQPARLVPVANLTAGIPEPASEAPRRMVAATKLTAGTAA